MLKMFTIGRNARFKTFVKVVDSFINTFYYVSRHVGYDMLSKQT